MTPKTTAEAAAAYFDAADDEEFIENLTKDIQRLLDAECEARAKMVDDILGHGESHIAAAIRMRMNMGRKDNAKTHP